MDYMTDKILPCKKCGEIPRDRFETRWFNDHAIRCINGHSWVGTLSHKYAWMAIDEWNRMQRA